MPILGSTLSLERCPHCQVHRPQLLRRFNEQTVDYTGLVKRQWSSYLCVTCGGVTIASAQQDGANVVQVFPLAPDEVDSAIPDKAREFLRQAKASLSQAAGAVMLAASSVDAMLKEKAYKQGSLYERIEQAAKDHLITEDMKKWAHQIRIDANDQRHADLAAALPTQEDARRCIDFAEALGEFLFVLPSRVTRGIQSSSGGQQQP